VCVCPLGTLQKWLNRSQAGSGTVSPGPKGQRVSLWSRSHTGRSTFGAGSSGCGIVDDWRCCSLLLNRLGHSYLLSLLFYSTRQLRLMCVCRATATGGTNSPPVLHQALGLNTQSPAYTTAATTNNSTNTCGG